MQNILRLLGILMMIFSFSMLTPVGINSYYWDGTFEPFIISFVITFLAGFILWLLFRKQRKELKIEDGFLIVVLIWVILSFFGALPFLLAKLPDVTFTDAVFETMSGLTTTGANVFHHLDQMSHSILYYRQQLHLIGGMGIIVLAVAILPMLGVGGMQLYRAETPGPIKDVKLTPRITQTAKTLWYVYLGLIAFCALSYWLAGMSPFDAVGESFSTISTGGFSLHDASFSYYNSLTIDVIGSIFMLLAATNFGLHFAAIQGRSIKCYFKNTEFRVFIIIVAVITIVVMITLLSHNVYKNLGVAFVHAFLTTVSMESTTGYTDGNFSMWPTFVPFLLMFAAIIGGCAASTAGGMKVVRFTLLLKHAKSEFMRLLHPKAVISIKLGERTLSEQIIYSIWGFIAVYFGLYVILFFMLLATGLDVTTTYGTLSACITNAGAGIGKIDVTFDVLNTTSKWLMIFAMLAGRLEFLTILILFTPSFWKK